MYVSQFDPLREPRRRHDELEHDVLGEPVEEVLAVHMSGDTFLNDVEEGVKCLEVLFPGDATTTNAVLPKVVSDYFDAMNEFDLDGILDTLAEDPWVNDIQRDFRGIESISRWLEKEIIGDKVVAAEIRRVEPHHADIVVTALMDGEYDKTNLPPELELSFYFSLAGDKISRPINLRNRPGHWHPFQPESKNQKAAVASTLSPR
ncbi:nuclear transport factor 2 family protein [Kibdelosporangium aridum]|uniref:nuclear transport factor 2 family protein n=1 Tax=Kibdelosporangium aridum TaxID=2030 RepID=UPI00068B2566|nr:nuclear transport factor 2 family protein [Kibdelosporangium aridum]